MIKALNEQLHQQVVLAREEERKHIARELHDQIVQALVGLNYHLAELGQQRAGEAEPLIARLQMDVRDVIHTVRRICVDLRPPVLDSLGLVAAIRSHLRRIEGEGTYRISLQVTGDSQQLIPEAAAVCMYRVLQEALINVTRHAGARHVWVQLQIDPTVVTLRVRDDGRGFQVPAQLEQLLLKQHFGLVGIRERLDMLDGTFDIESQPGWGTCVHAAVALPLLTLCAPRQEEVSRG